ncbi:MAG TPA: DUF4382 domain-containing protein [Gracilimonas sp.]|uniref:DUF4382 domain-containing protein n=1 Tax=Gracilimonas sp. TaxID=1974203 RepID=UPI002D8AEFB9|nr:DUF4382 domain-containing protein [Gracilimonas sp.]
MNILKRYNHLPILALLFSLFIFTACSTESDQGMGTMKVSLTDAPVNFDQVNIEILQVLVNRDESADDTTDSGWYSVMDDSLFVNLLDYQNGAVLDLGEVELEAGQYNQIRLLLGENNNVVIDGETHVLTTPSAQQSGYKININAEVQEGETYELTIDFDASQSIVVTGNNNYILKPVLRAISPQLQGSIAGTVLPLEAEPFVYAIAGEDTVGTQADEEGNFKIVGLEDGTYNVWFNPSNEAYADSLVEGIEIEDAEDFEFEEAIELEGSGS